MSNDGRVLWKAKAVCSHTSLWYSFQQLEITIAILNSIVPSIRLRDLKFISSPKCFRLGSLSNEINCFLNGRYKLLVGNILHRLQLDVLLLCHRKFALASRAGYFNQKLSDALTLEGGWLEGLNPLFNFFAKLVVGEQKIKQSVPARWNAVGVILRP